MIKTTLLCMAAALSWGSAFAETTPLLKELTQAYAWCRSGKITCTARGKSTWNVEHTGESDWNVSGIGDMQVLPGEIYEMACDSRATADGHCEGTYSASVILRGKNRYVLNWTLGRNDVKAGEKSKIRFMVPMGAETIEPRLGGSGPFAATLGPCAIRRVDRRMPRVTATNLPRGVISNEFLVVEIAPAEGKLTIRDRRNGRVWTSADAIPIAKACSEAGSLGPTGFWAKYEDLLGDGTPIVIRHELKGPEIEVEIDPEDRWCEMPEKFIYPLPFMTKKGERVIMPHGEGMSYPVDEKLDGVYTIGCGWTTSMSFFGITDPKSGEGLMEIAETPWDAMFMCGQVAKEGLHSVSLAWNPQMKTWGEKRRMRIVVLEKGGHVAMAKRYRAYAKKMGWLKTFREKAISRPNVLKLPGAVNFWFWTKEVKVNADPYKMVDELEACGIRHYIWSHGGSADFVKMMNRKGILVGCYDIVQDVYTPEVMEKTTGKKGNRGPNGDAWPNDCIWTAPDSNKWQRAWGLELKGGGMAYCANMCDVKAPQYLRRRLRPALEKTPYTMRFMDTTCSAAIKECYNPRHMMTRNECVAWRQNLLNMMGSEFGLVVGTENGFDAAVPYADYYEGVMSIASYRLPRAGRDVGIPWTNAVPENVAKYQIGEKYRIPLWELVFHDCTCAHWFWGDCSDRCIATWDKRDLFNVLYATAPMYVCSRPWWDAHRDRYIQSYKATEPIGTACGLYEMTDHAYLTDDMTVQRTKFANGVVVTVNFGDKPFALPEGGEIPPMGYKAFGL